MCYVSLSLYIYICCLYVHTYNIITTLIIMVITNNNNNDNK